MAGHLAWLAVLLVFSCCDSYVFVVVCVHACVCLCVWMCVLSKCQSEFIELYRTASFEIITELIHLIAQNLNGIIQEANLSHTHN